MNTARLTSQELIALAFAFGSVGLFVWVGVQMFSEGWSTAEEKYISGAERDMESMFLAIPPQQLFYLAFLAAGLLAALLQYLTSNTLLAVISSAGGFFVPLLILYGLRRRRMKRFQEQLIDMLISVANSLRAGFSLPNAFDIIRSEMEAPMSQEIGIVVQELRLGTELAESLEHLHERMPCQDLDLIKTAINISTEMGGNLNEVLTAISGTIRERFRLQGRIDALTAQGRAQAVVMTIIPGGFLFLVGATNPDYLNPLWNTYSGWAFLTIAALLNIVAVLWVRKIVTIDY